MIEYKSGNLLDSDAEALVNTVSLKRCGPCVRDKAATSETASYDSVANRVGLLLNLAL